MSGSEDNTKYGECRFCYALDNHRELMKEYDWNGTSENYFKLFLECFNVFLCSKTDKSNLICTSCVLRLREANSFKKMVLEAERRLNSCNMKQEGSMADPDICSNPAMLKVEIKKELDVTFEPNMELNYGNSDDDSMSEQEEPVKRKKCETEKICAITCRKKSKTEKLAYIHNTTLIIENSNVTPFKPKNQTGLPCFYCSMLFPDISKMKLHQQKHTKVELKALLNKLSVEAFIVYVDVTDLKCTVCNKEISNLPELKSHLVKKHNYKMQECPDRIVPFKLTPNLFECQECKCNYETFGALERHMNVHFKNYVCEECGSGYVTKSRFKAHSKQHGNGSFKCETCEKVYTTPQKLQSHIDGVHKKIKRLKCMKCDERFINCFKRQKHMVEVHGDVKIEYKCNVCSKTLDSKHLLSIHMKRHHLDQRDYQCEMCSYTCVTKKELTCHMIKHNASRIFDCSVCKKSYARKKTLRDHMRMHNNDKRYTCQTCGKAFVQNSTLKRHIKTLHPELQV